MLALKEVLSMGSKDKNKSSDRNRLDQDKTLLCILAVNLDSPEEMSRCYELKPQKELLHKVKKATMEYNQEHSSKQD